MKDWPHMNQLLMKVPVGKKQKPVLRKSHRWLIIQEVEV